MPTGHFDVAIILVTRCGSRSDSSREPSAARRSLDLPDEFYVCQITDCHVVVYDMRAGKLALSGVNGSIIWNMVSQ